MKKFIRNLILMIILSFYQYYRKQNRRQAYQNTIFILALFIFINIASILKLLNLELYNIEFLKSKSIVYFFTSIILLIFIISLYKIIKKDKLEKYYIEFKYKNIFNYILFSYISLSIAFMVYLYAF